MQFYGDLTQGIFLTVKFVTFERLLLKLTIFYITFQFFEASVELLKVKNETQ